MKRNNVFSSVSIFQRFLHFLRNAIEFARISLMIVSKHIAVHENVVLESSVI